MSYHKTGSFEASGWPYWGGTREFFFSMRNCHCLLKVYYIVQVPYFCLPANELVDVIAPSCYRCVNFFFSWLRSAFISEFSFCWLNLQIGRAVLVAFLVCEWAKVTNNDNESQIMLLISLGTACTLTFSSLIQSFNHRVTDMFHSVGRNSLF